MNDKLDGLRDALNDIDRRLIDVLADRQQLVAEVAQLKSDETERPIRDATREEALLDRLLQMAARAGLDRFSLTRLYHEILDHSVRRQQEVLVSEDNPQREASKALRVSYLGTEGSYSHQAAARHFGARGEDVSLLPARGFEVLVQTVVHEETDYGVLPIENTTAGSINEVYDLLRRYDVLLVGEEVLPIDHCLIGVEEVGLHRIRRVFSHPQALAQCSVFLRSLRQCRVESTQDTASAVARIRDDEDLSQAAIASTAAARRYGLPILLRNVADQADNQTRFVVVGRAPLIYDARIPCKTSLLFTTPHRKGALLRVLQVLADRNLSLTKLESRPLPGSPWSYLFYVDFEEPAGQREVNTALEELNAHTQQLKHLGTYPTRTSEEPPHAPTK